MPDLPVRVLVADDQSDVVTALRLLLRSAGVESDGAASIREVHAHLAAHDVDAVLMDLNYARDTTSGTEGLQLIADLHERHPGLPLIAMTGWASLDTAVEAMRRGARGFIPKPWDNAAVVRLVCDEVERARVARRATVRAEREWIEAQAVQRALLPSTAPDIPGFTLASRWEPALGFGGDYFDVVPLADGRIALCVADVCGKGLPAALLGATVQATVRTSLDGHVEPHAVVAAINRALSRQTSHGRFVTLCLIVLDPASGHATFCNAGHPAPILMRADESVERLDAGGMLAGVFADAGYESGCTTIAAGDRLLLFTDGLLEATDASGGEFGDTGLVEAMRLRPGIDAAGLVAAVFDDVRQWSCGPLGDDATALALTVERTWTAASHNRTGPADPAAEAGANTAKTGPTPPENVAQALSLETRRHA